MKFSEMQYQRIDFEKVLSELKELEEALANAGSAALYVIPVSLPYASIQAVQSTRSGKLQDTESYAHDLRSARFGLRPLSRLPHFLVCRGDYGSYLGQSHLSFLPDCYPPLLCFQRFRLYFLHCFP